MSDGKSTYTIVLSSDVHKFVEGFHEAGEKLMRFAEGLAALAGIGLGIGELIRFSKELINSAEALGKLSKESSFSVSTLSAIKEQTDETSIGFEGLQGSITLFVSKMQAAREKGGEAMDVFRGISQEIAVAVAQGRPAEQVYGMIAQRFHEGALAGREQMVAQELFGKSFREWIPLLKEGAEGFEKMRGQGITQDDVDKATAFNTSIRQLKQSFEDIARKLVMDVLPSLKEFVELLKDGVLAQQLGHFSEFFELSMKAAVMEVSNFFSKEIAKWGKGVDEVINKTKEPGFLSKVGSGVAGVGAGLLGLGGLVGGALGIPGAQEKGEERIFQADQLFIKAGIADGILAKAADAFVAGTKDLPNEYKAALDRLRETMHKEVEAGALNKGGSASPIIPGGNSSPGLTSENIEARKKWLDELRQGIQLNEKKIQTDPYATEQEKVRELIPWLQAEAEILQSQIDLQNQLAGDITRTDSERSRAGVEVVKLQEQQLANLREMQKLADSQSFAGIMGRNLTEFHGAVTNLAANGAAVAMNTLNSSIGAVSDSILGAIGHTKDWGQAWGSAMAQAVKGIIGMVTQYIAAKLAMMAVDTLMNTKSKKDSVGVAAASGTAGIAKAGEQGGWVGVLIYMGVFLAAMAAMSAIVAGISGGFAMGGDPPVGRPALVGEQGPELFIPKVGGTIIPAARTAAIMKALGGLQDRLVLPDSPLNGNTSTARAINRGMAGAGSGAGGAQNVHVAPADVHVVVVNDRNEMIQAIKSNAGKDAIVKHVKDNRLQFGIGT